jgi:hypothetical protein
VKEAKRKRGKETKTKKQEQRRTRVSLDKRTTSFSGLHCSSLYTASDVT